MRVVYVGQNSKARSQFRAAGGTGIALLWDRWDDYSYKTTFPTLCLVDGREVELGPIKIYFQDQQLSHPYLVERLEKGWDGNFPLDDIDYVSMPSSTLFYEQLIGTVGQQAAVDVAVKLRDASHMVRNHNDDAALNLITASAFETSLLRERGGQRAYAENWRILTGVATPLANLSFRYQDVNGELRPIDLAFSAESLLPHDINVVIGPNGVGKSQLLRQIVDAWLKETDEETDVPGFISLPSLSQVVVVSYSPFELFPVDAKDAKKEDLMDFDVYRYFGLRGRGNGVSSRGSIRLSRNIPKVNAAASLIDCLSHDQRFGSIKEWSSKVRTMEDVLRTAIDFQFAALRLKPDYDTTGMISDHTAARSAVFDYDVGKEKHRYIRISSDRTEALVPEAIRKGIIHEDGVSFFRDGAPCGLSSGQRLFSYIVINILGAIRQNSLILVDEPELFLHPTLEIRFVAMLKDILAAYASKALLATHSVVTVRETPAECVHVFSRGKDEIHISNPPFETFAADVQRITSYVFEDKRIEKPHEEWLRRELAEHGSAEALIEALGDSLNEELIVQLSAMEAGKW